MGKIFGIGLERTGTTSVATAMSRLGLKTVHFPRSLREINEADFSDDITVSTRYAELDRAYPGSRFILTVRDEAAWLDSCRRWYGELTLGGRIDFAAEHCFWLLYGATQFDETKWLQGYRAHNAAVQWHFSDRPESLLVLDVCGGEGWGKLMTFLGDSIPFPRDNVFEKMEATE